MKIFLWLPEGKIIPGKPPGQKRTQAGNVNSVKLLVIILDFKRSGALKKICTLKAERMEAENTASSSYPASGSAEGLCLFQRQVLFRCGMETCPVGERSGNQLAGPR